ncbi:n-acetyltransferase 5 [Cryptococcus deuterogattii R265]|uniref:n-acetyltransferase 5 n=1 Tax=Cryptococcus deuterogattii (strain R265) TaxID=294750 RepID=UPI001935AC19|nr:n-acetyltransferase 5 [Cryptococcus deuterogattii R265]
MSVIRPFDPTDILRFNNINADPWTATYHNGYYASYTAQWPDWCVAVEGAYDPKLKAYMISKHEPPAPDPQHHGHLTALSIAPSHRSLGLARVLMDILERLSGPREIPVPCDSDHEAHAHEHQSFPTGAARDSVDAWFVDLFVRCNNGRAISMYEKMGYSVYRRVVDYYNGMEGIGSTRDELDGFDMRKSMPKDTAKRYVRPNGRDILVSPDQVWA